MEEEKIRSTVRLSPEFHEKVRIAIARKRLRSFQQAVEAALEVWIEVDGLPSKPQLHQAAAAPGTTKEEQAQVARFLDFLRCGDAGQVELVSHALDLHQKKQRRLRKPA